MLGDRLTDLIVRGTQALDAAGVPYAVCGGVGMILAGRERATRDLDVVVLMDDPHLQMFKSAARDRGFAHHDRVDRHSLEGLTLYRFWMPIGDTGVSAALDVQQGHTHFHRSVVERAVPTDLGGVTLRVATPEDLILLKLAAWRPIDRADAIELIRVNRRDLDLPYLEKWAVQAGITDRLIEAQDEARRE